MSLTLLPPFESNLIVIVFTSSLKTAFNLIFLLILVLKSNGFSAKMSFPSLTSTISYQSTNDSPKSSLPLILLEFIILLCLTYTT